MSQPQSRKALAYSYVVVAILTLIYTFNYLDRKILAILAEPIRLELGLSDTAIGLLSGFAFAVFYTTLGVPLAWLADRARRVWIIAAACTLWSLFTAACGMATNFVQLALFRTGVAIGEAGGGPPSFSLISDYFPPERRGKALAIYILGIPLGVILGSAAGGYVAAVHGWRMAFFAVGLPGVLLAILLLVVVREPKRGAMDPLAAGQTEHAKAPPLMTALKYFFRDRTLLLAAFAAAGSSFVGNAVVGWAPSYLMRAKGMEMTQIAAYYSVATGVAGVAGTILAGWMVDKWGPRNPRIYGLVPGVSFLISLPFFLFALWTPGWPLSMVCMSLPFFVNSAYQPAIFAVVQNSVPPAQRAISSAILMFVQSMLGLSGGPLLVGLVSDHAKQFGDQSLGIGLAALAPFILGTAALYFALAASLSRRGKARALEAQAAAAAATI
ncbi:MAG: MFS transporter [Phenylobacterium sp.]|uniref:spinster family MFS transporter n=1 Tax=Phenylobacterium sp. TaxID=1871053 RepID=UPI0027362F35|nr:MFS transporter [Phenylobacterium sp.]MDP3173966.1 MFS transporter [Phenylobacterium sp.]